MNSIKTWLASYNITTHSVTVLAAFLFGAFYAVPQFHTLVIQIYNTLPGWVEEAVVTALALYAWYRKGQPTSAAPIDGTTTLNLNK